MQKLAVTSPTNGGSSVGVVCSQTQAMEFSFLVLDIHAEVHAGFHAMWLSDRVDWFNNS
jgi:hypothetical protein